LKKEILFGLLNAKIRRKNCPILASIHITDACNLKCSYCYASLNTSKNTEPTTEELLDRFDTFIKNGTKMIRLLGGEPLLRDDIGVLVDYLKERKIWVEITTNGTNVKKKVNTLKKVDNLCLSLDGNKETNDRCRGKGTYQTIINALDIVKDINVPIRLHGVITKYNYNNFISLIHMGELAKKVKARFGYSQCLMPKTHPDANLSPQLIKEFFSLLKELKDYPIITSDVFFEHIEHFPNKLIITKKEKNPFTIPCTAGKYHCFVDSDGRIYNCTKMWRKGLNMEDSFKRAWDNLSKRKCYACLASGEVEADAVFNLNPRAIIHAIQVY